MLCETTIFSTVSTNNNCSPPCSGGSGSAKHRSGFALCCILLHHILRLLVLLRKPLFATAKRHIPRTLDENIFPKSFYHSVPSIAWKIFTYYFEIIILALRAFVAFCSTTFGAGVNASYCPVTCPKHQLPKNVK